MLIADEMVFVVFHLRAKPFLREEAKSRPILTQFVFTNKGDQGKVRIVARGDR